MRNNRIEEIDLDQTNTKQHESKDEKLNFNKYLNLRIQIIRKVQEVAATDVEKCVKKSEMLEMWKQEIDLITQLLGNE